MTYMMIAAKLFASGLVFTLVTGFVTAFLADVFDLHWPFIIPIISGILTALLFIAVLVCAIWRI